MLKFWKRSGQREKTRSTSSTSSSTSINEASSNHMLNTLGCSELLTALEDEGLCDTGDTETVRHHNSRLSKTLSEVLIDKSALGYFIQYLEVQKGLPNLRCWLDIESFRSAAQITDGVYLHSIVTRDQLEENIDLRLLSPLPSSRVDHDSLSVSTDCDSFTADSNSLFDYSINTVSELRTSSAIDVSKSHRGESTKSECVLSGNCDKDVSDSSYKSQVKHSKCERATDMTGNSEKSLQDKKIMKDRLSQVLLDDALRIFKKYIAPEAPMSIQCNEDLRNQVIEAICSEDGVLNLHCYDKVQKYVYDAMEQNYFVDFQQSMYQCKYQIDVLTSGNIVLQDILYNESILFYFMEFLEQENVRTFLEFWLAATNFMQQLLSTNGEYDREEAQNDAIILYDRYFSLQATCSLGFGDKVRFLIEENICREGGPLPDCFNQAIRLVEHVLEKNYLKAFLSSQLYFKYLSELISTVQANGCRNPISKARGVSSDCSSELSISIQNTLLAMEDSKVPKSKSLRSVRKTDMSIDTRQLYDPDSLWRRRKTRRLSFGRITDFGRFETDVEPEPDRKSESKLTKAVKRLVNLEEDKTKEEMAWQVAEMIIKDITDVTLADVQSSSHS